LVKVYCSRNHANGVFGERVKGDISFHKVYAHCYWLVVGGVISQLTGISLQDVVPKAGMAIVQKF